VPGASEENSKSDWIALSKPTARPPQPKAGSAKRSTPVADALNKFLTGRAFADNISMQLARADLKLTVSEYLALCAIALIGGGIIAFLISKSLVFALVGVAAGYLAPGIYMSYMQGRRRKMFDDELGDTINLLVNGLAHRL